MFAGTPVAVAAGADFVVEGAVDLKVRLSVEIRRQGMGGKPTLSCSVPKIEAR